MRSTTEKYKQIIRSGDTRNWEIIVIVTFTDGQVYSFTEHTIIQGSFKVETAVSSDSKFDIGSAIISKCSFSLNNWDDWYTDLDFYNATAIVEVKLKGDTQYHKIGMFTVDEPTFAGSVVQLELLDNMWKFDKPFSDVSVTYPARCDTILLAICSHCGVTLANYNFHGNSFIIQEKPDQEMNCREMLQYIAMLGCNFCTITSQGYLLLRWYNVIASEDSLDGGTFNTSTTPYSDGDTADGGNFTDYTSGDDYDGGSFAPDPNVAYFTRLMSRNIGTDDITITGVKFVLNETEYKIGQDGYVLSLQNPLVNESNVSAVLNLIWDVLENFKIRPFDITALPDIAPEVGDCVAVSYKGDLVYSYLSSYTFTPSMCTAKLDAESPSRNLTTRYSADALNTTAIAKKEAEKVVSDFDKTVQQMNDLAINAIGAYQDYEDLLSGGRVYYLSNQPITKTNGHCTFVDGSTVFKATGDGFFVSTQVVDGEPTNWQNGYNTQTGELVVNVLNAIGVNADWIKAGHISADLINSGTLVVGGSGFNSPNLLIKDSHNTEIGSWNTNGITAEMGSFGKLHIDGERLVIPKDTNVVYEESHYGFTKKIKVKTTFNPYYIGWSEDAQLAVEFRSDSTGATESFPSCVIEVFKRSGRFAHRLGIFKLNSDGTLRNGSRGATDDPVPTFEELIDHTWGANPEEFYQITYTIYKFSFITGNMAYIKVYDAENLAQIGAVITEDEFVGNFRGHFFGQASFKDLELGDWSFDTENQRMIIEADDEDPTVYDGTYIGRDGINLENDGVYARFVETGLSFNNNGSSVQIVCQGDTDFCELYMYGTKPEIDLSDGSSHVYLMNRNDVLRGLVVNDGDYTTKVGENLLLVQDYDTTSQDKYYTQATPQLLQVYRSGQDVGLGVIDNFIYNLDITDDDIQKRERHANAGIDITTPVMWDTGSDERLKENITDLDSELSKKLIDGSKPKVFKYKHKDGTHYGFIAQEVREQLNTLGEKDSELECSMRVDDLRTINYNEYIPHLINYVKELKTELDFVKAELKALKEK